MFKKSAALMLLALSGFADAGIVNVTHNILLPTSGEQYIDLELDGSDDITMAERYSGGDRSYIALDTVSGSTAMGAGFVAAGSLVDSSLTWLTDGFQEPIMSIGNNYLAIYNASLGAFYGYATIAYDGIDMILSSYTYDDTGAAIIVGSAPTDVPEPGSLALLGLGLAGLGYSRKKAARN